MIICKVDFLFKQRCLQRKFNSLMLQLIKRGKDERSYDPFSSGKRFMKVVIYGKQGCAFCVSAKELCKAKGIDHEYIDFIQAGLTKEDLEKIVGKPVKTVPQILVDDVAIGGFNELNALVNPEKTEEE